MALRLTRRPVLAAWLPFDLAVCRLLLTHQTGDGAQRGHWIALMRPGGRIIAMEPLRDQGFPRFDPPIPAVERIRELDIAHLRVRGLLWDLAWEYGDVFPAAGLTLLEWRGHLSLFKNDTTFLELVGKLLPAQKSGLLAAGLTTEAEIDQLTAEIDAALGRPLRVFLGLHGYATFDYPWLLAASQVNLGRAATAAGVDLGIDSLVTEAVELGFGRDSASQPMHWSVSRILLHSGLRHVDEITETHIAEAVGGQNLGRAQATRS